MPSFKEITTKLSLQSDHIEASDLVLIENGKQNHIICSYKYYTITEYII